jgi:hypothetical protein
MQMTKTVLLPVDRSALFDPAKNFCALGVYEDLQTPQTTFVAVVVQSTKSGTLRNFALSQAEIMRAMGKNTDYKGAFRDLGNKVNYAYRHPNKFDAFTRVGAPIL